MTPSHGLYSMTLEQGVHFLSKAEKTEDGCWTWRAGKNSKGYGCYWLNGVTKMAHRIAYALMRGPIPRDLVLDHLCRNRACINPDHMEPVTSGENTRRGEPGLTYRRVTPCPHGHPRTPENIYIWRGLMACRPCRAIRQREYMRHRREAPA